MISSIEKWFAFVVCLNYSLSSERTAIELDIISSCANNIQLGWTIFTKNDELIPMSNCSLIYTSEHELLEKPYIYHWFPKLQRQGVYKLDGQLVSGNQYTFWMNCEKSISPPVNLTASDNCSQAIIESHDDPDVVYQRQTGLFDGTQDTVLGVVCGLFGFAIILVTSYYLWRRYRIRQRRLRIRSYLGTSLIDPFANMQNRLDEMENTGGERLMGSSESL